VGKSMFLPMGCDWKENKRKVGRQLNIYGACYLLGTEANKAKREKQRTLGNRSIATIYATITG